MFLMHVPCCYYLLGDVCILQHIYAYNSMIHDHDMHFHLKYQLTNI